MVTEIPPKTAAGDNFTGFPTHNTKEAALLYSLVEVQPIQDRDGNLHALRVMDGGKETCHFFFQDGPLAGMVRQAFSDPAKWCADHHDSIPDNYMPEVLTLILTTFHNWERLKDATKGLPLHRLVRKGKKIFIRPEGDSHGPSR